MCSTRRRLLAPGLLASLVPTQSAALDWGNGNWGEEVWGLDQVFEVVPALPQIGMGLLAASLGLATWWLMVVRPRRAATSGARKN